MINRLISVLQRVKLEPTAEELADALWLASWVDPAPFLFTTDPDPETGTLPSKESGVGADAPKSERQNEPLPRQSTAGREADPGTSDIDVHQAGSGLGSAATGGKVGLRFWSPGAPALPGALELGRALRPLKRSVPSRVHFTVDEEATARRIAEDVPSPLVLRPLPTRWLDLLMVVDEGSSMAIWQQTVRELHTLLERHGAFRQVGRRGLLADDVGELRLVARSAGRMRPVKWRELVDPSGRRLILIVSDCVSAAWEDGRIGSLIGDWARYGPVALIQVLPQRLWYRSGLGAAIPALLRAHLPAAGNRRLLVKRSMRPFGEEGEIPPRVPLPIAELERGSLETLAKMLAGSGLAAVHGVEIGVSAAEGGHGTSNDSSDDEVMLPARELVARFRATASPKARQLATLFAAANYLSLPVMRHVRQTMLPEATLGNLAEVFLGGLLREISEDGKALDPEYVRYEFIDEARALLLDAIEIGPAARVLAEVSDYVTRHLGYGTSFRALLADPTGSAAGEPIPERERPFARIGAMILDRFGGEYTRLAERLMGQSVVRDAVSEQVVLPVTDRTSAAATDGPISPRAQVLTQLAEYARHYETIRETSPPSALRARISLVDGICGFARERQVSADVAAQLFQRETDGSRIVALAILIEDPEPAGFEPIRYGITAPRSSFEQFIALQAALRMVPRLALEQQRQLRRDLHHQRSYAPGAWLHESPDNTRLIDQIFDELDAHYQILLLIDLASDNPLPIGTVEALLPKERTNRQIFRLSDFGATPTPRGTVAKWSGAANAIERMVAAARVALPADGLAVHFYVAGRAALPVFVHLGFALSAWARVTLLNQRPTGAWDVLPLLRHERGSRGQPSDFAQQATLVLAGVNEAAYRTDRFFEVRNASLISSEPGGTRVAVFVSTHHTPPAGAIRSFFAVHHQRLAGAVEVIARKQGTGWLDAWNSPLAMQQLAEIFAEIRHETPHATDLAVFVAGPATLAFLVGHVLNLHVFKDIWVPSYELGGYRFAIGLPWEDRDGALPRAQAPEGRSQAAERRTISPGIGPRIGVAQMERAISTAQAVLELNPPAPDFEGYRLARISGGDVAWLDLPARRGDYAVFGSHARCDVRFPKGDDVVERHLIAMCCSLGDGSFGLRLMNLDTSFPFYVDDDIPRRSIAVLISLAVRVGKYVILGIPWGLQRSSSASVVFRDPAGVFRDPAGLAAERDAISGEPAVNPLGEGDTGDHSFDGGPKTHISSVRPISPQDFGRPAKAGYIGLTLRSYNASATVELPESELDNGVLFGRGDNCLDRGLRSVMTSHVSRIHLLLLRETAGIWAFDLCSNNGTRLGGQRVRGVEIPQEGLALTLGPEMTLIFHPRG